MIAWLASPALPPLVEGSLLARVPAARILEALGSGILLGVAIAAWRRVAPAGVPDFIVVNVAIAVVMLVSVATILAVDALWGLVSSRIALRLRTMPYTIRLGSRQVRIGNPEALLLSIPFWIAAFASLASAALALQAPTEVFAAQVGLMLLSAFPASLLTVKALTEDPLSITLRKAGVAPRVARGIPWYSRLARVTVLGKKPLEAFAGRLEGSRLAGWLETRSKQALLPYTRREIALILASASTAGALAAVAAVITFSAWAGPQHYIIIIIILIGVLAPAAGFLARIEAARGSRASEASEEAAWLALAGSSAARAGLGLDYAVDRLASEDFPGLRRESLELRRRIEALGEDPLSALKGMGAEHPSPTLRELLTGYVDLVLSGGDPVRYLGDWVRELLHDWRARLQRFTNEAAALAEALIALLALGPIVVIVGGLLLGAESVKAMESLVLGVIPASLGLAGILALRSPGRRARYDPRIPAAFAAVLGGVGILAMALMGKLRPGIPLWLQLGAPALAAMIGWQLAWRRQDAEEREEEKWLGYILRRIAEAKRLGQPLLAALQSLAAELRGKGARHASELLAEQASLLLHSGKLEPSARARSWLWRASFRVLSAIESAGGGTAGDVEQLRRFVESWSQAWRDARANLRILVALVAGVPFVAVWALDFTQRAMQSLSTIMAKVPLMSASLTPPPPAAFELARIGILLSSLGLAFILSRLYHGTFYNMRIPITATLAAMAALAVI